MNNNSVLITYGWNHIAYIVLRSLATHNINVYVADTSNISMCSCSRFCKKAFVYPSFYKFPQTFIETVIKILKKTKCRVFLPVHEETLIVAKFIERFPKDIIIPIPEFNKLITVHDKAKLMRFAKQLGISIPKTFEINRLDDINIVSNVIRYPVVIKLRQSNGAKGVFYVNNKTELAKLYLDIIKKFNLKSSNYPIIQEYIKGEGWGVSCLYNRGLLKAKFTHKRLREKIYTGGSSTWRQSASNPLLENEAQLLLDSLKWHGIAMVEFKYDPIKKQSWMIEVNPRFWGSLALPVHSGVDFPWLLYKMAIEGDIDPVLEYKIGVSAKWVLGELMALVNHFQKSPSKIGSIKEFIRIFKVDIYDDLRKDDLLPFLVQCFYYIKRLCLTRSMNPIEGSMVQV